MTTISNLDEVFADLTEKYEQNLHNTLVGLIHELVEVEHLSDLVFENIDEVTSDGGIQYLFDGEDGVLEQLETVCSNILLILSRQA
jgi:hypothetical protein